MEPLGYINMEYEIGTVVGPSARDGMYYVATEVLNGRTGFNIASASAFRELKEREEPLSVTELLIRRSMGIK